MKKRFLSTRLLWASVTGLALAGMLTLSACDKDDDDDDDNMSKAKYTLSGDATGAQEVPPVTTTSGTGTLTGTYDSNTKNLIYTITWTGLSGAATVAHFHGPAAVGETASPIQDLNITSNDAGGSGMATDTLTASAALHSALISGKAYYNIHSAEWPNGEIRAQVILTK